LPLADGAADKLVGLKMTPSSDGVISVGETVLQENLFYHIRDEFYNLVQDDNLQSNKDNGGYRPHYYALRDTENEDIFWMVPVNIMKAEISKVTE